MNVLNTAHKKPLKTAGFEHRYTCSFSLYSFQSPTPFTTCENLGYYMLIKMSEIVKKIQIRKLLLLFFLMGSRSRPSGDVSNDSEDNPRYSGNDIFI